MKYKAGDIVEIQKSGNQYLILEVLDNNKFKLNYWEIIDEELKLSSGDLKMSELVEPNKLIKSLNCKIVNILYNKG